MKYWTFMYWIQAYREKIFMKVLLLLFKELIRKHIVNKIKGCVDIQVL